MAHGKKRHTVEWRALGGPIAHAFVDGRTHSACTSVQVNYVPKRDFGSLKPDRCRACEIVLAQTW